MSMFCTATSCAGPKPIHCARRLTTADIFDPRNDSDSPTWPGHSLRRGPGVRPNPPCTTQPLHVLRPQRARNVRHFSR